MTTAGGWHTVLVLAVLLLGPLLVGAIVGDLIATCLAWRDAVRRETPAGPGSS